MTGLSAIAYRSVARRRLSSLELDALLVDACAFNAVVGVTGVLFHHDGRFFQYIEGEAAGLKQVYERIRNAGAHRELVELLHGPVAQRQFERWHMGFCQAPESTLQELSNAAWIEAMPITRASDKASEGVGLALYHWSKWLAEQPGGIAVSS